MAWDKNRSRIAIAYLESSGNYEYRVALLPQEIDGVSIVHAVAENASSGNAIYIFRGERGLDEKGQVWLEWSDVLSKDRRSARYLGARKILHTKHVDNNLLEYITRNPNSLDKRGYSS